MIVVLCSLIVSLFATSENDIRAVLEQWPKDFNAKNIEPTCSLFAQDVIAVYPEVEDRDHAKICQHLTKIFAENDTIYHYEQPDIKEILVSGDLAVVRLIWTLKINQQTIRENGIDVFKRQQDGSWKIIISYAYPL